MVRDDLSWASAGVAAKRGTRLESALMLLQGASGKVPEKEVRQDSLLLRWPLPAARLEEPQAQAKVDAPGSRKVREGSR